MIKRIDHIGIAVESLEGSLPLWAEALGLHVSGIETVVSEQVKVAFLEVGSSRIELLESTANESTIGRHLRKRGAGIHHVALETEDLPRALERLRGRGVELVGDGPRPGAEGRQVAFLHPKTTGGVLVELVSARKAAGAAEGMGPGGTAVVYLRDPQEKLWGVLRRMDATGIVLEGMDLNSFDDWIGQLERGEESIFGPSVLFVPMLRVEKILLDQSSGELLSMADRFLKRTGRTVQEVLGPE